MRIAAQAAVVLVALLHFYFLVLEMFIWEKPYGLRTFGNTRERAAITQALAANQGLYNGFLGAGLLWGLSLGPAGRHIVIFFLCLRGGGGRLRRPHREPEDSLGAGGAGGDRAPARALFVRRAPARVRFRSGGRARSRWSA